MGECTFNTDDLQRSVVHATNSQEFNSGYETEHNTPALLFVKDEGIYLMSNGSPRDNLEGQEKSYVTYADGCNPTIDDHWWETARELVGGDDFVEVIELTQEVLALIGAHHRMHVTVNERTFEVSFSAPKSIVLQT